MFSQSQRRRRSQEPEPFVLKRQKEKDVMTLKQTQSWTLRRWNFTAGGRRAAWGSSVSPMMEEYNQVEGFGDTPTRVKTTIVHRETQRSRINIMINKESPANCGFFFTAYFVFSVSISLHLSLRSLPLPLTSFLFRVFPSITSSSHPFYILSFLTVLMCPRLLPFLPLLCLFSSFSL